MTVKIFNAKIVDDTIKDGLFVYLKDGKILKVTNEDLPFDKAFDANGNYLSADFIN